MMHENNRPGTIQGLTALGATDEAAVQSHREAIGALRARLRAAHVRAPLAMRAALTPERIATYDRLCGHAGGDRK